MEVRPQGVFLNPVFLCYVCTAIYLPWYSFTAHSKEATLPWSKEYIAEDYMDSVPKEWHDNTVLNI